MSEEESYFEQVDAGAADCSPIQAGSIKIGTYCMIKGNPCKIISYSIAKPGKHGACKINFCGVDIFTGKKYEDCCPTSLNVYSPIVSKVEYKVADIDEDDFVSLYNPEGGLKQDLKLQRNDEEIYEMLTNTWIKFNNEEHVYFTVLKAIGKEAFISARTKAE